MNKPIFKMVIGLPGSGKSTYAKEWAEVNSAKICSSDDIRKELFGDESTQTGNDRVFELLHKRVKEYLLNNENVIYDATNIKSKRRRAFLSELKNIPCYKTCTILATPFEECCKRNEYRSRSVPRYVIEKMYKNWDTPYYFEGWDSIHTIWDVCSKSTFANIDSWIFDHMEFDQDNPHHSMTLGEHCMSVGEQLSDDTTLCCAGFLHDCGKPFTKSFTNSKGETTAEAHYYQHHCVGAYDSLFYAYPYEVDPIEVSVIVNLHMYPYYWERDDDFSNKERLKNKYKNIWGEDLFEKVMRLHDADKSAH